MSWESPWISTISRHITGVSFKGFPKTFITAGELELLRDEITILKDMMERDTGEDNVEYYLAPLAIHDFVMLPWHEPERTDGLKKIAAWVATL